MLKLRPNSLVRPKIFWPSIMILLIVSITFYIFKEEEKSLRIQTQKQLAETIMEKKAVENEFIITLRAKDILQEQLSTEKEKSYELEKVVEEKVRRIKLVLDKLEKEIIARREAEIQLIVAMQEKRILGEKVREIIMASRDVELEKIVVKAAPMLGGKILTVDKEHAFIVVNLGRANNLRLGTILSVYRNDEFIGRVQVEKVEEQVSAAAILLEWQDIEFKENDQVREI